MSPTESLVMELLRGRERYGLELVDASDGALKRGSVYVTLARMEEKGFVDSRQEERGQGTSGLPRRLYRATPYGRKVHGAFCDAARGAGPETDGGEMSFEARVIAFCDRFLSQRAFELIVAPALADLQFDEEARAGAAGWPTAPRCCGPSPAALATTSGADSVSVFKLTLLSACLLHVPARRSASRRSRPGPILRRGDAGAGAVRWCR